MSYKIKDGLIIENIKVSRIQPGTQLTKCPKCSHRRCDLLDLGVRFNESCTLVEWKCANCLWSGSIGDTKLATKPEITRSVPKEYNEPKGYNGSNEFPEDVMAKFVSNYRLDIETLKTYGVYFDAEIKAIAFPYVEEGKTVNVHYLTPEGKSSFEKNAKFVFYGIDEAALSQDIIMVYGELNMLALKRMQIKNVIGIPQVAASMKDEAFQYLAHAEELLKSSSKVILALPSTKTGDDLRAELARRIGLAKCQVLEYPTDCNDISHVIKKLGDDVTMDVINTSIPYPITGLYEVKDFEDSLLTYYEGGMASGVSTGWSNLDAIYTVMDSEVTVVTGIPNTGKSEWLDALAVNLAEDHSWKFGIFSPENSKEAHVTKLVEKKTKLPSTPNHPNRMNRETFMNGADWVGYYFHFIVGDDEKDLPTLDWILDRARSAVLRYGINGLIIDPWNEIEHSRPSGMNETDYISLALSKIKRFARTYKIHIWIVAHPQKIQVDPKTNNQRVPGLYDISGSAHWANKVDNGAVIDRSVDMADTTVVYMRKVRHKHVGRKGEARLVYDPDSGTFAVAASDKNIKTTSGYGSPLPGDSEIEIIEVD